MGSLDETTPNPLLRRRNSIATSLVVPAKLELPTKPHHASSFPNYTTATATVSSSSASSSSSQSFPSVDFELISIKPPSYTSLKDLLPSIAVNSPKPASPGGGNSSYEISIRNHLVKQAAWAYLRPMSTSPDSGGRHLLRRLWTRFTGDYFKNRVSAFFRLIDRHIIRTMIRAFDRLLRVIRFRTSR